MAESPVGYLPDNAIQPDPLYEKEHNVVVVRNPLNAVEQRRGHYPVLGKRIWEASTIYLTQTLRKVFLEFFDSHRGMLIPFYFFISLPEEVTDYIAGTVTASSTFILPAKATSGITAKVDDVAKTVTVQVGVGSGGEDQITFTAGVQTGVVKISGTVRLRFIGRFDSNKLATKFISNVVPMKTYYTVRVQEL